MIFNSLNSIIDDILLELRNSNIAESESLNRLQIEQWIHNYRALLIKQDIDKGRDINQMYIQELSDIHLDKVLKTDILCLGNNNYNYISNIELPKLLDFHFGTGLISVTDLFGNIIQVSTRSRAKYQKYRKYTCNDYIAYLENNKIFVEGSGILEYINAYVIAEDPTKVPNDGDCYNADLAYPIPANMIPTLKQMIFSNELNVMLKVPVDNINNSSNDLENIPTK